jgi:hypothetical protein
MFSKSLNILGLTLLADSHRNLNGWKNTSASYFMFRISVTLGRLKLVTAESLVTEPSACDNKIAIKYCKRYKPQIQFKCQQN